MAPRLIATGIPELIPMVRTGDPRRHVSFTIRQLCLKLGHYTDTGGPPSTSLMELGSTFEDVVAKALADRYAHMDRYARPGELEMDGLIGTPDLYDVVDQALIEVKLTKLSSRNDIESTKFWKYWVQLMAYCHMMGVTKGRLHIGHINGDYTWDKGPDIVYNVWEEVFTPEQLFNNWRMLKSHSDAYIAGTSR